MAASSPTGQEPPNGKASSTGEPLAEHANGSGMVESRFYIVCAIFLAGRLSATAKNGWEVGGRRGVKLAIGMGSHWLNMHTLQQCACKTRRPSTFILRGDTIPIQSLYVGNAHM